MCLPCHTNCASCTTGALGNYSDCTACLSPSFSIPITGSYFYCANYCPEGFTASVPTCTASTSPSLIFTGLLNNFDGPWTSNGITATQTGLNPAKERGHYFSGIDEYASLSDFALNFRFTILTWVRVDELSADQTIFSKDRGTFPDGFVFRSYITATDGFLGVDLANAGDTFAAAGNSDSSGGNAVVSKDWTFVGFSINMDDNTLDTNVRLWVNNDAGSTGTISGKAYLDDATNHKAFIGAHRTDATTYTDELRGFMYVIHIYNSAIDNGDDGKYGNSGCSCDSAKCTDDAT